MDVDKKGKDRRRFKRIATEISLKVGRLSYPTDSGEQSPGRGKDIGKGGICFRSSRAFAANDLVVMQLHLPGWQRFRKGFSILIDDERASSPLTAIARITWCGRSSPAPFIHMGAQFVNIYEDDYAALQMYLEGLA